MSARTSQSIKLSLSVRIAEGFLSKEIPTMPLEQVADIALEAGYKAICMRASQIGVQSSAMEVAAATKALEARNLPVSMVTGNFDIVYNNDAGPEALRNITPHLELAKSLEAPMVRVALKTKDDIPAAREAANRAEGEGIRLVHQCHNQSFFETVDQIEETLAAIDHPNFGLIFEPANLELCGEAYGAEVVRRLAPWICNVYLQNQHIHAAGAITLAPWCCGPVNFDIIPIHQQGGIDFPSVIRELKEINYEGPLTVHQSAPEGEEPLVSAKATADYLTSLLED